MARRRLRGYSVSDARYAKGKKIVRCPSNDGWKTRAARLAEQLCSHYTGREHGYVMSPTRARKFIELYAAGWDACSIRKELQPPRDTHETVD